MSSKKYKQDYKINIIRQHQLCEVNFLRLLQLLPNLAKQDHTCITVNFGAEQSTQIHFDVKQRAPYTTHLRIHIQADWGNWLTLPDLEIRLYHDVQMAEVVFSKQSEKLKSQYSYPNPQMYQPNEKELWNKLLAELLQYVLKGGLIHEDSLLNFRR
ncbi:hypothetical protein ACH42_12160 [Endozoicomonas sp. (ex Bugula neritina AB1)]|nr:hypothetical protein ACH42_12160 [Endozoicomonas sp. (ex Bugula neritina AB1)]